VYDGQGEREQEGDLKIRKKTCKTRNGTQYKTAQKNITGMKVYDWASALGPGLYWKSFSDWRELRGKA